MPSFDVVSSIDMHEMTNAVDQANRELSTRFDFKGVAAQFELNKSSNELLLTAPTDFQIQQMGDILRQKCAKRQIDTRSLTFSSIEQNLNEARQSVEIQQGIETDIAKKIVKLIKTTKLKVQAAIQGDQVRITGKKRDDLQQAISFLKEEEGQFNIGLQYENFRD